MTDRLRVALAMRRDLADELISPTSLARLTAVADVEPGPALEDLTGTRAREVLSRTDVLLTGWGAPRIDATVLDRAPRLRAVVHAAGSVKGHLDRECWRRGLAVSTAADANAIPVAEYALAAVLLSGKRFWRATAGYVAPGSAPGTGVPPRMQGNHGRVVGVVGASRTGRRLLRLLQPFSFHVLLCDPFVDHDETRSLGATLVELDTLVSLADVVSLHAPALPATRHLIDRRRLALLPDDATVVNTARGSLVDTVALVDEVASGRLNAVLDVTEPEPLPEGSALWGLPGAVVTPHIAGALGTELSRLGAHAVEEVARLAAGLPLATPVAAGDLDRSA